ncbi:hypothetical protein MT418_005845 [Batrachochytrium dendrobatidis]
MTSWFTYSNFKSTGSAVANTVQPQDTTHYEPLSPETPSTLTAPAMKPLAHVLPFDTSELASLQRPATIKRSSVLIAAANKHPLVPSSNTAAEDGSFNHTFSPSLPQEHRHHARHLRKPSLQDHVHTSQNSILLQTLEAAPRAAIACVSLSADGSMVLAGARDGSIHIWSVVHPQSITAESDPKPCHITDVQYREQSDPACLNTFGKHRVLVGHAKSVTCIHSVGAVLFSTSEDGTVMIWDTTDGSLVRTIRAHSGFATAVCSAQGLVYTGGADSLISAWSPKTGRRKWVMPGHTGWITALEAALEHPNRLYSSATDCTIRIWDTESGRVLRALSGHSSWVHSIAVTRDFIYSGSRDGEIKTWSATTGDCLSSFIGHDGNAIHSITVANHQIVSCGQDGCIVLWDLESQVPVKVVKAHSSAVTSIKTAANGSILVSGSLDSAVKVWNLAALAIDDHESQSSSLSEISFPTPPLSPRSSFGSYRRSWSAAGSYLGSNSQSQSPILSRELPGVPPLQIRTTFDTDNQMRLTYSQKRSSYTGSLASSQNESIVNSYTHSYTLPAHASSYTTNNLYSEVSTQRLRDQLTKAHEQLSHHDRVKLQLKGELSTLRTILAQSKSEISDLRGQLEQEQQVSNQLNETKSSLALVKMELNATRFGYDGALSWIFQQVHRQFLASEIELHSINRLLHHPYTNLLDDLANDEHTQPPERNWEFDSDWDSDTDTGANSPWWRTEISPHTPAWSKKAILWPYFSAPIEELEDDQKQSSTFDSSKLPSQSVVSPHLDRSQTGLSDLQTSQKLLSSWEQSSTLPPLPSNSLVHTSKNSVAGAESSLVLLAAHVPETTGSSQSYMPPQGFYESSDSNSVSTRSLSSNNSLSDAIESNHTTRNFSFSGLKTSKKNAIDVDDSLASVQVKRASVRNSVFLTSSLQPSTWLQPFQSLMGFSDTKFIQDNGSQTTHRSERDESQSAASTNGIERPMATIHRKKKPKRPAAIVKVNTSEVYRFDEDKVDTALFSDDKSSTPENDVDHAKQPLRSYSRTSRSHSTQSRKSGADLITSSTATTTEWKKDPHTVQVLEDFLNDQGNISDIEFKGPARVARIPARPRRHTILDGLVQYIEPSPVSSPASSKISSKRLTAIPSRRSFQYTPGSCASDASDTSPSNRYLPLYTTSPKQSAGSIASDRTSTLERMASNVESVLESALDNSWGLLPGWLKSGKPSPKELRSG